MKQSSKILVIIFTISILTNCDKPKVNVKKYTYNQKANELILQLIFSSKCNCVIEIPNLDYSEMSETEKEESRKYYTKLLNLSKNDNVDSILKIADKFTWDENLLKKNNIKFIKYDSLEHTNTIESHWQFKNRIYKICKNGFCSIQRPILDKNLKTAALKIDGMPSCLSLPLTDEIYKFESGAWIEVK